MKYALYIFVILLMFAGCKKQAAEKISVAGDSAQFPVPVSEPVIDKDSLIIEDFKAFFEEECKKWPVNFHIDTLAQKQTWCDNLGLSKHTGLKNTRCLLFVDKTINYRSVSIEAFRLSDIPEAQAVVDEHCKAYNDAFRKGESVDFIMENVYAKIPYRAIRIHSTIFEITATNTVGHIMYNTVDALIEKYNVSNNDIIPCERE
ncbi:hypothetical protein D0T84_04550 [Dysgonomonas sp. 521]|uniref:hypothetical protein n=1 Tax=Dysgonomonas sp. 521 TaxID=2302932 RepID=UPI0013D70C65|nr:hypothetical protein [Dysgonomonas sp. 521]NDV94188.1 hypothetical protein [Dysgonomonas sp. 521]